MARNVELKAKVASLDAVRDAVSEMAVTEAFEVDQEDTFFRLPQGRLKLRDQGDGSAELIYYERPDEPGAKLSSYERAACADAPAMRRVLEQALGRRSVVRKHREVFIVDDTRVHLDSVEGLGPFIELEAVLADGEPVASGRARATELLARLGIPASALVECAYVDLLERAQEHGVYEQ
jgi:predicted adenylyl cyclase CyaB